MTNERFHEIAGGAFFIFLPFAILFYIVGCIFDPNAIWRGIAVAAFIMIFDFCFYGTVFSILKGFKMLFPKQKSNDDNGH